MLKRASSATVLVAMASLATWVSLAASVEGPQPPRLNDPPASLQGELGVPRTLPSHVAVGPLRPAASLAQPIKTTSANQPQAGREGRPPMPERASHWQYSAVSSAAHASGAEPREEAPSDMAGPLRGTSLCGPLEITQSVDVDDVQDGNSFACLTAGATNLHQYARCYDMAAEVGIDNEVQVNCVQFGVEENTPTPYAVTVALALSETCPPSLDGTTLLATVDVDVPLGGPFLLTADFASEVGPVTIPANANLVVDILAPDRSIFVNGDNGHFFIGTNDDGQTGPSYIIAPQCGADDYTDMADIGFGDVHIVETVFYTQDELPTGACCNDAKGTCEDGVEADLCLGSYQRFFADTLCDDVDPPCGSRLNDEPCLAHEISCGETININNENADYNPTLVLQFDPTFHPNDLVVAENTLWYRFVAEDSSARVRTCQTPDSPSAAQQTVVSIFDERLFGFCPAGECTTDGECLPGSFCQNLCDPSVPGSACAEETPTGCCNACESLFEIATSHAVCGAHGQHGSVCVQDFNALEIGRTYYIMVGSMPGTRPGDITLELLCPCGDAPSGACCLGGNNCFDIFPSPTGADDCRNSLGTWQGDATTCATLGEPCVDVPDHCNQAVSASCNDTIVFDNSAFDTSFADPTISCRGGGQAPGYGTFWITFEAEAESIDIYTSANPELDTIITLYDTNNACGATTSNEIACNDDAVVGQTVQAGTCVRNLEIGRTYTLQVASWNPAAQGEITVSLSCPGECDCPALECPAGAIQESESCGENLNGGCTQDGGPAFEDIACGQTVCGFSTYTNGSFWDRDWYKFTVEEDSFVTWDMDSRFEAEVEFVRVGDCVGNEFQFPRIGNTLSTACTQPGSKTEHLSAGTYYVEMSPEYGTSLCGDANEYVASLSCAPVMSACCDEAQDGDSASCSMTTQNDCQAGGGHWMGLDDNRQPITCASSPCVSGACCGLNGTCEQLAGPGACLSTQQGFVCDVTTNELPECGGACGTTCFGDVNGDGVVSVADRGFISANVGETSDALICQYDLDGNGVINVSDRGFVSANVGLCTELPDFQNGSGLNNGQPDPRFDDGRGGAPAVPEATWQGFGSRCAGCPCILPACVGDAQEAEPACGDNYEDTYNGGCSSEEFSTTSVTSCGETICGSAGWFMVDQISCLTDSDCPGFEAGRCDNGLCKDPPFAVADADWYEIDLSDRETKTEVTWTVDATFPTAAFIVSAPVNCRIDVERSLGDCSTAKMTACLDPGVHYLVIMPQDFDGTLGCDRSYTATVSCGPCRVTDQVRATGQMTFEIFEGDLQGTHIVPLQPPLGETHNMMLRREKLPYFTGQTIDTEIIALTLEGGLTVPSRTILMRQHPNTPSTGEVSITDVDGLGNLTAGDSVMDVALELEVEESGDRFFIDSMPTSTEGSGISGLPPYGSTHSGPPAPVDLLRRVCTGEQVLAEEPNLAIPDGDPNGLTSTILVPTDAPVTGLAVAVDVDHTFISNLVIRLEHDGLSVNLWFQQCAGTSDLNVVFDDDGRDDLSCFELQEGPRIITADELFGAGEGLSLFNGLNRGGEWTLTVRDGAAGDSGVLNSWSLRFCNEFSVETVGQVTSFSYTVEPEPETGACCVDLDCNETVANTRNECEALDGQFYPGESCAEGFTCPLPCIANGNNCAQACTIYDGLTAYTTHNATTDGPPHPGSGCEYRQDGGLVNNDIWRSYTATCTGTLTVETCNDIDNTPGSTDCDSRIAIYSASADDCGSLPDSLLECNDVGAGCFGYSSLATTEVEEGQDILVRLGGFNESTRCNGEVYIACEPYPLGACCDGQSCIATTTENECAFAWLEGEACDDALGEGNGFDCYNPSGACCDGTTCQDGLLSDCDAEFYEGENCFEFTCPVGDCCTYGNVGPGCSVPSIEECVCAVDAFCCQFLWDSGCVQLVELAGCATCPSPPAPPNDACTGAACVADGEAVTIDTFGATVDSGTPSDESSCGVTDIFDVWYAYTPAVDGPVTVDTCDTEEETADTTLAVYLACGGLEIDCNDDTNGCSGSQSFKSSVTWNAVSGVTYYIRLASPNFGDGVYTVTVQGGNGTCP